MWTREAQNTGPHRPMVEVENGRGGIPLRPSYLHTMRRIAIPFFLIALTAEAQQYLGVQTWGGTDSDQLNALAVDPYERVFALGGFWGSADMDPGPGDEPFVSSGVQDIFLSRFAPEGQWEWSVQLGGNLFDHAQALAVDAGGVYVGGEFAGTLVGGTPLVSNGSSDALLARYTLEGNLLWAIGTGSTGSDYINDVAVDVAGNVYAIGYFQGTVDFDPGADEFPVNAGGSDAMFLWKLTPDGELLWVRTWNGTSSENGMAVAVDAAGAVWIGGGFFGNLDLDPGTGNTAVSAPGFEQQAFIVQLDADGDFLFGGHMGGNGSDGVQDLKVDAAGAVIAVGNFGATGDLDPGAGDVQLPHLGGPDTFVLKFSAAGHLLHAASMASAAYDQPRALATGPNGAIMITGGFDGSIDLDPGVGDALFTSNGISDVYVLLLDSALNYLEGAAFGGSGQEDGTSVAWSASDRRYVGGLFEYTVDLDFGDGVDPVASTANTRDAFLTRLCSVETVEEDVTIAEGESFFAGGAWQSESGTYTDTYVAVNGCDSIRITHLTVDQGTGISDAPSTPVLRVHPIPAHEQLTITTQAATQGRRLEVMDATGRVVLEQPTIDATVHTISLTGLAPGTYVARLRGEPGSAAVFIKAR